MDRKFWLLALLATAVSAEPEQIELQWGHAWMRHYIPTRFKANLEPRGGTTPLEGDGIWYLDIELAPGKRMLLAAQPKHETPRVWVDGNFDGQLSDETPVELSKDRAFLLADVHIEWRDTPQAPAHKIPVKLVLDEDLEKGYLHVTFQVNRQAHAVIGGRLRWIVALSDDGDLRVDDADHDRLFVDIDGDGKITTQSDSHERVRPGEPFRVGTEGYVIRLVDPTGAVMSLDRIEKAPAYRARPWPAPRRRRVFRGFAYKDSKSLRALIKDYRDRMRQGWGRNPTYVLRAIGGIGTAGSVKFLVSVVRKQKDDELAEAASLGLADKVNGPHGKLVMTAARAMKNPDRAVALLGSLESMQAEGRHIFLLELLATTRHDAVRELCADVVAGTSARWHGELGAAMPKLRNPAAAYFAYKAFTRYQRAPPSNALLNSALAATDPRLRLMALADVAWVGRRDTHAEFVTAATTAIKRRHASAELSRLIIETLGPVAGAAEIPLLFSAVPAATRETRARLTDLLGAVRGEPTAAAIRGQITHKEASVRRVAVEVLGRVPSPGNGEALATQLRRERDATVRIPLVTALGKAKVGGAAATLADLARRGSSDEELREAALVAMARIGFGSTKIAAYFAAEARQRDWTRRLDATDAVARYGDGDSVPFLARRLADEEWRIRDAAAQGLGRIRVREGIGPLIARLEGETDRRARRAMANALFRITGQHLYDIDKLWIKWWSRNQRTFVVPPIVPTKRKSKGGRKTVASFYGVPVESDRIVFVIDKSGSMGGAPDSATELDKAVKETLKVVAGMRNGAMVDVIFFDSRIHPWAQELVKLDAAKRKALKNHVLAESPSGGTNLYDGLEMALKIKDVDTIYLLSDGAPGSGKFVLEEDIVREIGKLNKRLRIQIHGISIGRESSLLKKLAEQSGGTYARR